MAARQGHTRLRRAHRSRQGRHFNQAGITSRGWVFAYAGGEPLSPSYLTHKFNDLVAVELGLKSAAAAARLVLNAGKSPPGGGGVRRRGAPALAEITA